MKNSDDIYSRIFVLYQNSSILTKFHVWLRLKTCPFFSIEKFIPKEGIIMDYGCGHGIFAYMLSFMSPNRKIYGVDISTHKLKEAQKVAGNYAIQFLDGDKKYIESLIEHLDCIAMLDVLCYFEDKERREMLERFYKKLKPGAWLIIKDIQRSLSLKFMWLYLQEIIAVKLLRITRAGSLNFFSSGYLSNLLKNIGFGVAVVDLSQKYPYPHILYVCRKQ